MISANIPNSCCTFVFVLQQSYIFFAIGMTDNPKVFVGAPNDCEIAVEINLEKAIKGSKSSFNS